MKSLCIIPARGGSKRIPHKNIRDFFGKPVISYSIAAASASRLFDEVMVSTDSEEIAAIAKASGAQVPFMRSAETAGDHAGTMPVIHEVLQMYRGQGKHFDSVCCVYPANPFVTAERIREGFQKLSVEKAGCVLSAVRYSFPVQRSFTVKNGSAHLLMPEHIESRSQDLEPVFHDAAQFYWFTAAFLQTGKSVWESQPGVVEIPEAEAQDIDTLSDWSMAELKYKLLHNLP